MTMTQKARKLVIGVVATLVCIAGLVVVLELARTKGSRAQALELTREGTVALDRGDSGAAIEAFRRALTVDPRSQLACIGLAEVIHRKGDHKEATKQFDVCIALAESSGDPTEVGVARRARQAVLAK